MAAALFELRGICPDGCLERAKHLLIVIFAYVMIVGISPGSCGWPQGTYGIPAHKDGCPHDGSYQWRTGSVLQKTEWGSQASASAHLLGMEDGPSDRITQRFCMKTSFGAETKSFFMPGKYCIFKLHECPSRFQEGWIYWDDAGPWFGFTIQNATGFLPDGEYKRNTRIEYCCRLDGLPHDPITLPASEPFYLLKHGDTCQAVENMKVAEEWVQWRGESSYNMDSERGVYPTVERNRSPFTYTKLFYCYYTPLPPVPVSASSWFETLMLVLYIIGVVVGIIFLAAVVLATVQKAQMTRSQKRHKQQQQLQLQQQKQKQQHHRTPPRYPGSDAERSIITMTTMPTSPCKDGRATGGKDEGGRAKVGGVGGGKGGECGGMREGGGGVREEVPLHFSCKAAAAAEAGKLEVVFPDGRAFESVADDRSSVNSICLIPDADSEAPPSYDEVIREGQLDFVA